MKQTVYKIVYEKDGKFLSMLAMYYSKHPRYEGVICEYKIGEKTLPSIEHSLLFALTDQERALKAISDHKDMMRVIECEAEVVNGPRAIPFFLGVYTIQEFWRQYNHSGWPPEDMPALNVGEGIAFCEYITPIRIIE